ncbi:MAG TPA: antibiotic biosynthesis monooxygenase [Thermoplasmata archaeon]|nr:antibiotic biosynthesis monooxygenase [Thermoplasmata archaeon]
MFCAMAFGAAKPGQSEALVAAALDHAAALRRQPGCVAAYVLEERGTGTQVSVSIFQSEADLARALEATRPVIAKHRLDELTTGPHSFRLFDVRGNPDGGPVHPPSHS